MLNTIENIQRRTQQLVAYKQPGAPRGILTFSGYMLSQSMSCSGTESDGSEQEEVEEEEKERVRAGVRKLNR